MTFEEYWSENGVKCSSSPVMELAFKEIAEKSWKAAISGQRSKSLCKLCDKPRIPLTDFVKIILWRIFDQ